MQGHGGTFADSEGELGLEMNRRMALLEKTTLYRQSLGLGRSSGTPGSSGMIPSLGTRGDSHMDTTEGRPNGGCME